MDYPKISIITPSYNQGKFIEKTITSILNQNYPNLEYIIIDGGSTDESVEIIKKYSGHLKFWISEKDEGQADAINKGLKYCTGQIFNWVNSDDYLEKGALSFIAEAFTDPAIGMVAGAVQNFENSELKEKFQNNNLSVKNILSEDWNYVYHQPGVWLQLGIMKKTGLFRKDFHYCFDHEYMLRYLLQNDKVYYTDHTLAYFRIHSESKTISQNENFKFDFQKMYRNFYISQKGQPYYDLAKMRSLQYDWLLMYHDIRKRYKSRLGSFFAVSFAILKDPNYQFNKKNLGTLKHILFGEK